MTPTEQKAKKAHKPTPANTAMNAKVVSVTCGTATKVVEASDDSAEARRLAARAFIMVAVTDRLNELKKVDGFDPGFELAVLKQLEKVNPPVLSDDKKAEQLETLKRARAVWAEQTAARRAAAAKAKK